METDELALANSPAKQFLSWCRQIGFRNTDTMFVLSTGDSSTCSICNEAVETVSDGVLVHMHLFSPGDKQHVHGSGPTIEAARTAACEAARALLESFEPEIFTLRRKRLRVRIEEFGATLPKTDNMLLLEGDKQEGLSGLPPAFVDLMTALDPDDEENTQDSKPVSSHQLEELSRKLLSAIPSMKSSEVESVFNKIGLSFCDEMNHGMNPFLFSAIIALALGLNLESVGNDEKLKLSFSKVMEQVVVFNCDQYPGFNRVVARMIRYFASARALPFMSKNRLESIAIQLSQGGPASMKVDAPSLAASNEKVLHAVVAAKTPPQEYIDSLFFEFSKINSVIRELFNVDGAIYGSFVNGFPTSSSDIDVVINFPDLNGTCEQTTDLPEDDDEDDSVTSHKCLAELNRLHDAIKERYNEEFQVSKIEGARVPILIVKKGDKIELNISFNHEVVIHNSALLRAYSSISPRVRELVVLVKHWAKKREINDALQGTLSSYSYVLLVIAFLQGEGLLPDLQHPPGPQRLTDNGRCSTWFEEKIEKFGEYGAKLSEKSLSELFSKLFDFYLYDVNYVTDLVSISQTVLGRSFEHPEKVLQRKPGQKFLKKIEYFRDRDDESKLDFRALRKRAWLAIADPFEFGRVLGTSARGMETITKEMKRALELMLDGQTEEIFVEYNRKDRSRMPSFPFNYLARKDPIDMGGVAKSGLRIDFRMDDVASLEKLKSLIAFTHEKSMDKTVFSCLCYMSRIGLVAEKHLQELGLLHQDEVDLQNTKKLDQLIRDAKSKAPQVQFDNPIANKRRELLDHRPQDGKGGIGKGKGTQHSGGPQSGKGKGGNKNPQGKGGQKGQVHLSGKQIGTM